MFVAWAALPLGRGYSCPLAPRSGVNGNKQGGNRRLCYCSPCLSSAGCACVTVFVGRSLTDASLRLTALVCASHRSAPVRCALNTAALLRNAAESFRPTRGTKTRAAAWRSARAVRPRRNFSACVQPPYLRSHVPFGANGTHYTLRAGSMPVSAIAAPGYTEQFRSCAAAGASGGASAGNLFFCCKSRPALRQRFGFVAGADPLQAAFTAS